MTGALERLRKETAEQLEQAGVRAVTAFEPERQKRWNGPVAAVSLAKVVCAPGGFRDYLGTRRSQSTGGLEELYGRGVELTLAMDIYGPRDGGESGCRRSWPPGAREGSRCWSWRAARWNFCRSGGCTGCRCGACAEAGCWRQSRRTEPLRILW